MAKKNEENRLSEQERADVRAKLQADLDAKKAKSAASRGQTPPNFEVIPGDTKYEPSTTLKKEEPKKMATPRKPKPEQATDESGLIKDAVPYEQAVKQEQFNVETLSDDVPEEDYNAMSGDTKSAHRNYTQTPLDNTEAPVYEVPSLGAGAPPPPPPPTGNGGQPFNPSDPNNANSFGQGTAGQSNFDNMGGMGQRPSNDDSSMYGGSGMGGPQEPFNPSLNELDDRDKKKASEMLVDGILDGYEKLHHLGNYYVQMPESELQKLAGEGKIDLNRMVDTGHGNVTIGEFIQNYNRTAGTAFELDPTFRKDVRDPMVRIFLKKGWGVTDEQYVLGKFAMDLGAKMAMFIKIRSDIRSAVKSFSEKHVNDKNNYATGETQTGAPAESQANNAAGSGETRYEKNPDGTLKDNNVHVVHPVQDLGD